MVQRLVLICLLSAPVLARGPQGAQGGSAGIFTTSGDVGHPAIKGAAQFDAATGQYRIAGSGANMWAKQDQFHYVWREISGNFTATATVRFLGQGADHRKAGIVLRQSLDTDATHADVVVHGNGMPSLQWRPRKGEDTNTFDLPVEGPGTFKLKMVRTGVRVFLYVIKGDGEPKEIVHTEVTFQPQIPLLVGLAVCSHDAAVSDTAVFSDVSIAAAPAPAPKKSLRLLLE